MFTQTPKKRVLFVRRFIPVLLVFFGVFSMVGVYLQHPGSASAATQNTVNFQARLQTAAGGVVADGNYNVEFKLYSASSGGTALWTEDYFNSASNGVRTVNGYLTANLGSITAFPTTINWDQQLYLTMNIGGTTVGAPTLDGEMSPRLKLTAVPYAFSAGKLSQFNATSGFTSTLSLVQPTVGNQAFQIQDQGAAGTYNLLTQNQANISYIQNGVSPQTSSNFNIDGTGTVGVQLLTPLLDAATSGGILNIGTTNAASISVKKATAFLGTVTISGATTVNNTAIFRAPSNTATAYQFQNLSGNNVLNVNTSNSQIELGTGSTLTGALQFANATNNSTVTISAPTLTSSRTVTFGDAAGTVCLDSGNCGATTGKLQNAYTYSTGTTTPEIKLDATRAAIDIQDADTTLGANNNFLSLLGSNSSGKGSLIYGIGITGNIFQKPTADKTNLYDVRQSNNTGLFVLDSVNARLGLSLGGTGGVPTLPTYTLDVGGIINSSTGYRTGGVAGATATCTSGQYLQNQTVSGGITTGGTCSTVSGGSGGVTLQGTTPGSTDPGNFHISGTGIADTSILSPLFDVATASTVLTIGTNASSISLKQNVNIDANKTLTVNGATTINSTGLIKTTNANAFSIQNGSSATNIVNVDTTTNTSTFQGLTSVATFGSELIATNNFSTGWSGAGWTRTSTNATHTSGVGSLSPNAAITSVVGSYYQVVFDISGRTAGSITPRIGGNTGTTITAASSTQTQIFKASTTASLLFVPTTDFNGTISNVSVKQITPTTAIINATNSGGTSGLEIRGGGDGLVNTYVGVGSGTFNTTGTNNTGFGQSSLYSDTTGNNNIGFGGGTLQNTTTGSSNSAVGALALQANTTGIQNTAFGYNASTAQTTGNANVAVGSSALLVNTTGDRNVSLGSQSGAALLTGSNNLFIGYQAGLTSTGSNNVFLGSQAGANETGSGLLYISNSNTATPLIGGDFSAQQVVIGGKLYTTNQLIVTAGGATINGGLSLNTGPLSVNSNFSLGGNFDQSSSTGTFITGSGAVTLAGNTTVSGSNTFSVGTGATTLGGTLAVTGAVTGGTYNGQTISGTANFTGTVNAATSYLLGGSNINTAGTLNNVAYLNQANTFSAAGTALTVTNNASVGGTLAVAGTVTGGSLVSNSLDASSGALTIGNGSATGIAIGKTASNIATTINGTLVVKPTTGNDSPTAVQIQNAAGDQIISVNSATGLVTLGKASTSSGQIALTNAANTNLVNVTSGTTTASYTIALPTAIGTAGQCLAISSIATTTEQLGYASCTTTSGTTTVGAIDSQTKSANGAVISGNTLYLQTADASNPGLVSTGTQTIAGAKTFQGGITASAGLTIATGQNFVNGGSTLNTAIALGDYPTGGSVGSAAATVDVATALNINQTTAGQVLTLPSPTVTTAGRVLYVSNIGSASFTIAGVIISPNTTAIFIWNGSVWTSAGIDGSGTNYIQNTTSTQAASNFNISGTGVASTLNATGGVNTGSGTGTQRIDATGNLSNIGTISSGLINGQTISSTANFTGTVNAATSYLLGGNNINSAGILSNVAYLNQANTFSAAGTALTVTNNASVGGTLAVTGAVTGGTYNGQTISSAASFTGTVNAATSYLLGGNNINNAGILSNVAYLNQANTFTGSVTANAGLTVATGYTLTNAGSTLNTAIALGNFASGGSVGSAASTVDVATTLTVAQTTASQTLTLPNPTVTTAGRVLYISNIGSTSFTIGGIIISVNTTATFLWNGTVWTSAGIDGSGTNYIQNQSASTQPGDFKISGTGVANLLQASSFDTAVAGSLALGGSNASSIVIGKTASNIGTSINGTVLIKPTTGNDSATAFVIQNAAGTALMTVDSTSGGTITFGSGANTFVIASTGEPTLNGTARHSRRITLQPEFSGAVLTPSSGCSTCVGTMTSDAEPAAGASVLSAAEGYSHNFYNWTTTQVANQQYDIWLSYTLPSDFSAFSSSNPFNVWTKSSSTSSGTVTMQLFDADRSPVNCYGGASDAPASLTPTSANTWQEKQAGDPTTSGCSFAANDRIQIRFRLQAGTSVSTKLGELRFDYLSKY